MFYDTVSSIKARLDSYGNNEELAKLINEDPYNLSIVDLIQYLYVSYIVSNKSFILIMIDFYKKN